jgi:transcriptional regulator with XRE-family HTH domain
MEIHVGKLVLDKLKERGMKKSEFARRINKSRQNVQDIFKRESLDTHLLFDISKVLEFNFFEILSDQVNVPSSVLLMEESGNYKAVKNEKQKQKNQLLSLSKLLKQAQKEIIYLKKINNLLEKKKEAPTLKKKEIKRK